MARTRTLHDDDLVTLVGLFVEAHSALVRTLDRRLAGECDVGGPNFEVLIRLARSPDHRMRMSDLAAETTLTPSGLTRAIDRLERAGLVRRDACPTDRRVVYAVLTDEGIDQMARALPVHAAHIRETLGSLLSPDELESFGSLLRTVRDGLQQ